MKLSKLINTNKGLSLVETMAAILIFGLVLASTLEVCAKSMVMGKRSELSFSAYSLAKSHIETLKSLPFSNLTSAAETDAVINETGVPDVDGIFKRNTAISANYENDSNLVQVTVTVDYQVKGQFANKPASLSAVVFQYA